MRLKGDVIRILGNFIFLFIGAFSDIDISDLSIIVRIMNFDIF